MTASNLRTKCGSLQQVSLFAISQAKSMPPPRQLPISGYDGAPINANRCFMTRKKPSPASPSAGPVLKSTGGQPAPPALTSLRGVHGLEGSKRLAEGRGIEDIECITPDLAGVPRGKMMPSSKFTSNTSLACLRRSTDTRFPAISGRDRQFPL
jgi:hypothetical protein